MTIRVTPFCCSRAASGSRGAAVRQLEDEGAQFLARHAALDGDLLDLALAHVAGEADQRRGGLRQPLGVDHDLVADEADDDAVGLLRERRRTARPAHRRRAARAGGPANTARRRGWPRRGGGPSRRRRWRGSRPWLSARPRQPAQHAVAGRRGVLDRARRGRRLDRPQARPATPPSSARVFFGAEQLLPAHQRGQRRHRLVVADAAPARRACRARSA